MNDRMIKIIPLSKAETKLIEPKAITIQNVAIPNYSDTKESLAWLKQENSKPQTIADLYKYWVMNWYKIHDFAPNNTINSQTEKISKILGMKPQYHVVYEYRTAVWGFQIEGYDAKIILYNSKRGTMIFAEKSITEECVKKLLQFLIKQED